MPVTDYIEETEDLLDFAVEELKKDNSFKAVEKFAGTNESALFEYIPELESPAAVVVYVGSSYGNRPRRTAKIAVVVGVECLDESDKETARQFVDKVAAALDEKILNQAVFRIRSDNAVDFQNRPAVAFYMVNFEVEDH